MILSSDEIDVLLIVEPRIGCLRNENFPPRRSSTADIPGTVLNGTVLAETAKLRGSTIGRTSISSELSIIKYKPKMKKWPPKSLESRFF